MGILPLQFQPGQSAESLGLTGRESYDIPGITDGLEPGQEVSVVTRREDGTEVAFKTICRIDTLVEVDYYRQGGVLLTVLRRILRGSQETSARV